MAKILGEVLRLNTRETVYSASGSTVLVRQHGSTIASGEVDRDEAFEIEIPSETAGEVEIILGMHFTAPVTATVEPGQDLRVQVFYNNHAHYV